MATKMVVNQSGSVLQWVARDTGKTLFTYDIDKVDEKLQNAVLAYGVKQIIADGGALDKDASTAEKLAMMEKRANSLTNGTWGMRVAAPAISEAAALEVLRKMGWNVDAMVKPE